MTVQEEIAWHISEALRLKLTAAQKKRLRKRADREPGGVPGVSARPAPLEQLERRWLPARGRALPAGDRPSTRPTRWPMPASATRSARCRTTATSSRLTASPAPARPPPNAPCSSIAELADAHVTLALGQLFAKWSWAAPTRAAAGNRSLNPKLPLAHAVRALFLITCARFDEALAEARTARDLDPLSLFTNMGVAWVHHFAGDHEEAIRQSPCAPATWRRRSKRPATS